MSEPIIHTEHLSRYFGTVKAVDDLSLEVPEGIVFGFLGPNGAGKTTTIHLLLGLLEPTQGVARVMDYDSRSQAGDIRAHSGALLEFAGLYERMSAEDNLDLYGRIYHIPAGDRRARIKELLTHLDLWERRKELVSKWSRGMKQKLAVARALFHHPPLIFLDEPTAGFDPIAAAALRNDLASLVGREGVTVFLNTHNLNEAEKLCAQVGVIRQGKLLTVGNPDALRMKTGGPQAEIVGHGFNEQTLSLLRKRPEVARGTAKQPYPDRTARRKRNTPPGKLDRSIRRRGGGNTKREGQLGRRVPDADGGRKQMNDFWTMIWKESKDELFRGEWQTLIRPLLFIGILGILFPIQTGVQWLAIAPGEMLLVIYLPFFFIINFIGDAIAGERERHTLETLLASRISDRAILLGKVIMATVYTWGMVFVSLLLGLVTVNLTSGQGTWGSYSIDYFLGALVLILLTTLLAASGGVLISLRSATVRQAQQTLTLGVLGLGVASLLALKAMPAGVISTLNYNQVLLIIMAILGVLDALLLTISMASFQRARLILS
ncbi:MAG: ATP-binding cassette domain-containing protein [Anaerolineales bacterium]